MTTYGPARKIPGSSEPTTHFGWNGVPFMMRREFAEHLVFGYIFNTNTYSVYSSSEKTYMSAQDRTRGDHSWNQRHLRRVAAVPDSTKFVSSNSNYFVLPMTGYEFAHLTNEFTLLVAANVPNTNAVVIGESNGTASDGFALGRHLTGGGNYNFAAWYPSLTDTFVALSNSATTGTGIEIFSGSLYSNLTASVHGWNATLHTFLAPGTATLPAIPGGNNFLRIGASISGPLTGSANIAAVWGFSKAFTNARLAVLFEDVRNFMVSQGVPIVW